MMPRGEASIVRGAIRPLTAEGEEGITLTGSRGRGRLCTWLSWGNNTEPSLMRSIYSCRLAACAVVSMAAGVVVPIVPAPRAQAARVFLGVDIPRGSLTNSRQTQSEFLAALDSFDTEDFDSFPFGGNVSLSFPPIGVTVATSNTYLDPNLRAVSPFNSLFDRLGDEVFTFSTPVTAFGAFFIGLGSQPTSNQLSIVLENTSIPTSENIFIGTFGTRVAADNVAYIAVIDAAKPFNRLTVKASNNVDAFQFDDLTIGFAVPESVSIAAWTGIAIVGLLVRRRLRPFSSPSCTLFISLN